MQFTTKIMSNRFSTTLWAFLLLGAAGPGLHGQLEFADISEECGILPNIIEAGFGTGVSAFDFDDDGDIDIFLPQQAGSSDRLYLNDGSGNFTDVAAGSGLDNLLPARSALWFDYDDDRLVDLLIASDCIESEDPKCESRSTIRLYRQTESGTFEDVTVEAGLDNGGTGEFVGHRSTLCCGDVDRDGDLDLLIGQWKGELQLMINTGGSFVNEAEARGIVSPNAPFSENYWQSVMYDFNSDGWIDIFSAVDFNKNQLWLNQGNGTFVDIAESAGVDFAFNEMGVTLGDYDNDSDMDIFVTNIFEGDKRNLLLRNDSSAKGVRFEEVSIAAGVDDTGFGWGATFLDANNDTKLDLAVTNGWFAGVGYQDRSRLFLGDHSGAEQFLDASQTSGFDDDLYGTSLISADLDGDGDLDLLQNCNPALFDGPFRVLENRLNESSKNQPNWLIVRPRQLGPNHWCIGATVSVQIGKLRLTRPILAGCSIHGQEPAEAAFGLGDADQVDRVSVRWPNGDETVWENVTINGVFEAFDGDLNLNGSIDRDDMRQIRTQIGPCPDDCQADLNHDGRVDRRDVILLRSMFRRPN